MDRNLLLARQARWPPIFMYHKVAECKDEPAILQVSPKQFEAQMLYLKRRNLKVVSVHELLQAKSTGEARRLIGVTFDDGHKSVLQNALPVLERLGFSATVYVVANWMLEAEKFESKYLNIGELREMAERGIEIGSHSLSHPKLSSISKRALLTSEISDSRKILYETLGKEVLGFCYPYGDWDERAAHAVQQAGYSYSCAASPLIEARQGSIYYLPRVGISNKDGAFRLEAKRWVSYLHHAGSTPMRAFKGLYYPLRDLYYPLVRRYRSKLQRHS